MKVSSISSVLCVGGLTAFIAAPAHATNGMALSGYGAIADGLGGAAQAYDSGNSSAINNVAALALMQEGSRVEIGANFMYISAETWADGVSSVESDATLFVMPNLSYIVKRDKLSFGIGAFSQGGMGADYGKKSFLSVDPNSGIPTGLRDESNVMIGRLIFPVAFQATDRLSIGASVDVLYALMTMKQAMPQQALMDMMTPGQQTLGVAAADPNTAAGLGAANFAHFDFSEMDNWGFGGQLGLTFKATDTLTFGASYQFETRMGDLEADGSIQAGVGNQYQSIPGTVKIKDFQWPATSKIGLAFQATDALLLVADIKYYDWSGVMESLKIRFKPDMGGYVNVDMYQKWDDQTVFSIGAEYKVNPALRVRAGFNYAANPVPQDYLQHLGEAITESHLTLGLGYDIDDHSQINAAYVHTFENSETNDNPLVGVSSSLAQNAINLSYSYRF
ncbi:OmpP1/FadL family transporter [Thiocystis violascens]|uniref:Long-chain fatty acid transport protein n=1 Tax=Thiocystis violascens (strain ATCC 17096 / DSM 198 / 6111) TaxID=765911 RepID=I3Y8H0_THIV6|nr:outer membrane protein transport protein [Thiocystis violascens]AFL73288.1 long-chain fatty acid transport protein [Thiocystis violascens DSM 198]